jgi:hypothetical protein
MPKCLITLEVDFDLLPDAELMSFLDDSAGDGETLELAEYKTLSRDEFEVMPYADFIAVNMEGPDANQFFFAGSNLDHEIKSAKVVSAKIMAIS